MVEMERCGQCGQPRWICNSEDPDIDFHVRVDECHATQARAKKEKQREKAKKDPVGISIGADPFTYSQTPLEKFRLPFYAKKAEEHEKVVAERPVRPRDEPL